MEHITTGRDTTGRGRADLHVHTLCRDGGQSPEAIVRAAARRLDVVGITDHDHVGGALRGRDDARGHAGVFSRLYDAWAALRNVEWMLPVTAGSDAHDVWYLGSAFTTFPGHDAAALRAALQAGRTRARVEWSWTAAKMPRHGHIQSRSAIRFLQGGHRGHS